MKKLIINGMVLTQEKKVGVPRYVTELLRALDERDLPFEVEIAVPHRVDQHYRRLKKTIVQSRLTTDTKPGNILWQAVILPQFAKQRRGFLLHPAMGYSFLGNDILIVYDLQPEHFRENYTLGSELYERGKLRLRAHAIRTCKRILTISKYVKQDIIRTYRISEDKIEVVPCGWDHFNRVVADEAIFSVYPELGKRKGTYYFSLGSRYAHKNQGWIYAAAKQNPKDLFVVTGYNDVAGYSGQIVQEAPENVLFTGYLPDGQVKALMMNCRAFLQPSLSEGFGLPPMEALSVGARIVVSNVTSLPEVYGETASYINPMQYTDLNLEHILSAGVKSPEELLEKYTWSHAADAFEKAVMPLLQEDGEEGE